MANLNQFYKGEAIKVTIKNDDGSYLSGDYMADGTTIGYVLLTQEPSDWSSNYGNYYKRTTTGTYQHLTSAETFQQNKYYKFVSQTTTAHKYAGMRAYPDNFDLENGDIDKIKKFTVDSEGDNEGKLFTLSADQTKEMEEGSYTIEIIYGKGDTDRTIVKTNHSFVLFGSAYKKEDETQS